MKRFFPFVAVVLGFFLLSFNPRPVSRSLTHQKNILNAVDSLNPTLYPLYIENSKSKPQLHSLLRLENRGCFTNHFKKIIFQYFYQDYKNGFTLTAYIGRRKKKDFDSTVVKFSSYITSCGITNDDQIGSNVYLGDIELTNQKAAIKILKTLSQDSLKYKFIVFKPVKDTSIIQGVTRVSVNYALYTVSDTAEICNLRNVKPLLASNLNSVSANPSPPHGGN